ncbi:MAG TPA: caspase family protein [Mycobacteriales bacterium]|nr:caspase family protein [Mycobacteriales bacterium]
MRVRRVVALAVVVLLPGLPSHGATPRQRIVTVSYAVPMGETTGRGAWLFGAPTASDTAQADEHKVTVSATDRGGPVALAITRTMNGTRTEAVACAPMLISVSRGTQISATPLVGRCPDGTVSAPIGGQVTLAFHKRRVTRSLPAVVRAGAPPSMRWAVLIGITDYAGSTHSTVGGTGDVVAIRKALLQAGWRDDHILIVKNGQASAQGIRSAFAWLAQRSTPRTFSLFHFSGHVCIASRGPCPSGHTYLWAADNRFVPETEVRSMMRRVRGYSWLDVAGCEAGAFDLHASNRLFTGSSKATETSYESPDWRMSYWSGLVWDRGFSQGFADNKGIARRATIGEMVSYGRERAPVLTQKGERGPQHPVVAGGSGSWTLYAPPGG